MLFVVFADFQIAECRLLICLDTICDPNGGPAMIAWLLAFWASRLHLGYPQSLTVLFLAACLRRFAAAAPGENQEHMFKQKANRSQ